MIFDTIDDAGLAVCEKALSDASRYVSKANINLGAVLIASGQAFPDELMGCFATIRQWIRDAERTVEDRRDELDGV